MMIGLTMCKEGKQKVIKTKIGEDRLIRLVRRMRRKVYRPFSLSD